VGKGEGGALLPQQPGPGRSLEVVEEARRRAAENFGQHVEVDAGAEDSGGDDGGRPRPEGSRPGHDRLGDAGR
jgi:hypothetical protein